MSTHHISDVDTWGAADRSYYIFVILSVLFGFFGLDHFYLRSFGTGTQKFIVNCLTLGMWYIWDLIQIFKHGDKVRTEGLSSPLDWIHGIGRGVFIPLDTPRNAPVPSAPKSYLLYAFLAIFFGWFGADKFYMGRGWEGVAKLLSVFNIFLFLFGLLWVAWDAFHAFFMMDSILKDGITNPMPYSMFFTEPIPGTEFIVQPGGAAAAASLCTEGPIWCTMDWIAKTFGFPMPPKGLPLGEIYKDLVAPVISTKVIKAIKEVQASPLPQVPTMPEVPKMPGLPEVPKMPELKVPALPEVPKMPELKATGSQVGGGGQIEPTAGPGPVIAGSLTALIIAGGLKGFYDFISKQYG
jgi:TM2 domain-containing membrane protein YozV